MRRYLKVYLYLIKMNIARLLIYRVNFFSSFVSSIGWAGVGIFTMYLLTFRITSAYGWTKHELIILAALYPAFVGVFFMIFARNIGHIPEVINKGELDVFLTKPLDSQFLLSTTLIDFMQIFRIVISIVFIYFYAQSQHVSISIFSILLTVPLFICGIIILFGLWFFAITFTVWYSTLTNVREFLYTVDGAMRYPYEILLKNKNLISFLLLPFMLALSIPAKTLLQKSNVLEWLSLIVLTIGSFAISRIFWKFALRFYTSTG